MIVLITGGSSGIGKAAAKEFVKKGAFVILQARDMDKLAAAAKELDPSGEKVQVYSTDLSDSQAVLNTADEIISAHGVPNIVVNSAGAGEWLSMSESSIHHYQETIDSPYLATVNTCKVFYDRMKSRGTGHFIIINSVACYFSFQGATGYLPSRWALLGFARAFQADLHSSDINVSMIAFGKVDSPYFKNNPISEDRIPGLVNWVAPVISTKTAGEIVAGIAFSGSRFVVRPRILSLFVSLNRLLPGLFRWLLRISGSK